MIGSRWTSTYCNVGLKRGADRGDQGAADAAEATECGERSAWPLWVSVRRKVAMYLDRIRGSAGFVSQRLLRGALIWGGRPFGARVTRRSHLASFRTWLV